MRLGSCSIAEPHLTPAVNEQHDVIQEHARSKFMGTGPARSFVAIISELAGYHIG